MNESQKKSSNHKYSFKIYQYGNFINEEIFNDYNEAQKYFILTFYNLDVATVPFIDDVEMPFMKAYRFYKAGETLKYRYIYSRNTHYNS